MTRVELQEFLEHVDSGALIKGGSEHHRFMHDAAQEAFKITAEFNSGYRDPGDVRALLGRLTGRPIDDSVTVFTPFHSEFGKNLHLGKNVFINLGCRFQDTGGITIGDGTLIGHGSTLTPLNHAVDPARRADMTPSPILIGPNVWLGAAVTVVPGSPSATAPSSAPAPSSPRTSRPTPSSRVCRPESSEPPNTTRQRPPNPCCFSQVSACARKSAQTTGGEMGHVPGHRQGAEPGHVGPQRVGADRRPPRRHPLLRWQGRRDAPGPTGRCCRQRERRSGDRGCGASTTRPTPAGTPPRTARRRCVVSWPR